MSWKVFSFHQIDILSEKSYGWYCAVGYVGLVHMCSQLCCCGPQDYSDSPSPPPTLDWVFLDLYWTGSGTWACQLECYQQTALDMETHWRTFGAFPPFLLPQNAQNIFIRSPRARDCSIEPLENKAIECCWKSCLLGVRVSGLGPEASQYQGQGYGGEAMPMVGVFIQGWDSRSYPNRALYLIL